MRAVEKKLIERNLDLLFEFEKYVLEHPEITEKIPRDAVVFMKVAGDEKFNLWSERQAKKAGQESGGSYFGHGEKDGPGSFTNRRARPRACSLVLVAYEEGDRFYGSTVGSEFGVIFTLELSKRETSPGSHDHEHDHGGFPNPRPGHGSLPSSASNFDHSSLF
jgi:Family of unknown function (DUF5647)